MWKSHEIISGPSACGKTTLLYGPYACGINDMDNKLAHVCCLDDVSVLTEEFVKACTCTHLIVVSDLSEITDNYGDRKVMRLTLTDPIDFDDIIENVVTKLSTRKQLGSLLGWCLQNYDIDGFSSIRDLFGLLNMPVDFFNLLMRDLENECEDPSCPTNSY